MVLFKNPVNSSLRDNGNQLLSLYICLVLNDLMFKLVLTRDIVLHPREPLPVKCCRASFILTQNLSIKKPVSIKGTHQSTAASFTIGIHYPLEGFNHSIFVRSDRVNTDATFLFIFIPAISIAPLQVHYYSEALPTQ